MRILRTRASYEVLRCQLLMAHVVSVNGSYDFISFNTVGTLLYGTLRVYNLLKCVSVHTSGVGFPYPGVLQR